MRIAIHCGPVGTMPAASPITTLNAGYAPAIGATMPIGPRASPA